MRNVRKLVATAIISSIVCQMMPVKVIAETINPIMPPEAFGAVPNQSQLNYHEEELAAFIHFGMNTFTNSEWGNGKENPNNFNPTDLDADEWVRTLKEAGFKRIIMIGKHHDGFVLWKSEVTDHDVEKSTDWQATKGGEGDVLAEVSAACTKYDMDMGLYLSPWDASAPSYGYGEGTNAETDTNGDYNEFYMAQLREVLGNPKYGNDGKFVEVWMDGAKGSGAAAQHYEFDKWFDLIEELQPGAVVFSPYGTDVRWIGNESGEAGDPVWSKINKQRIRDRYDQGLGDDNQYLNNGDSQGDIWSVGECDVSLTSGWFWHQGNGPKTMEQLAEIYFKSVGRGQPLLLNVAPDKTGHFTAEDIARIKEFSNAINNTFDENLATPDTTTVEASSVRGNSMKFSASNVLDDNDDTYWTMNDGETTGSITIDLGKEKVFDVISIEEYIKLGQRVSEFSVDVFSNGVWRKFGSGKTIGAKRLVRNSPVSASKIRINIEDSLAVPLIENVEVYKADEAFEVEALAPAGTEFIDNVDFINKDSWNQEDIGIGNTGMYSSTAGTDASFTFTGTKAWIVGTFDPSHGIMEVWIDDEKVSEVDTYKPIRSVSQIIYSTDDLEYGEHTVKVVVKGEKNSSSRGNAIGLDCAYYLNNNGAGMFEIEEDNYTVNEGDTKEINIRRVGGTTGAATVHFSTSPDSAVHGRHYNDVNEIIEFSEGQETATISISTVDNNEKAGNVKFFCNIDTPTNGAIIGFNKKAQVTIIDNDIDQPYTEENPFVLPRTLGEEKLLEAELFTLDPIEGNKYVRVAEDNNASNGKKISWFEEGNKIKVPFNASVPGVYTFKMKYQSGRSEGNLNKINWSGTNIMPGSKSVKGTGTQEPIPFIETSFDIEITKAGAGELIFTADSQASPNIDFFEVMAKELGEVPHGEDNPIILSNEAISVEAETLQLEGIGGEIESKDGASDGKVVGWLGNTSRGNAWLNMWINSEEASTYDMEIRYLSGANDILYYTNNDGSILGEIQCENTSPNFETKTIRVYLNKGLDRIKFFNDNTSTVNIDSIKITKVGIDKSELENVIENAKNIIENESDKYTEESINGLKEAVALAEETVSNEVAMQEQLDVAKLAVENAISRLEEKVEKPEKVNKVPLKISIDYANELKDAGALEEVVPAVVKEFNKVLEEAILIYNNELATQAEVDNIFNNLVEVIHMIEFKQGDKSELENLINSSNALNEDDYTEESWSNLEAILQEANKVFTDENAMQDEVSEIVGKLQQAIKDLEEEKKVDKLILKGLVDKLKETDSSKYIPSTWTQFANALEVANFILTNESATQEDVDSSYNTLLRAYLGLRLTPDKSLLEELIKEVKSIDLSKYTAKSVERVKKALEDGTKVLANEESTEKEVNTALENLKNAKSSLVASSDLNLNTNSNQNSNADSNANTDSNVNSNSSTNNNVDSSSTSTGSSTTGKLPQTGTAGVAVSLMSAITALLSGVGLSRKKKN